MALLSSLNCIHNCPIYMVRIGFFIPFCRQDEDYIRRVINELRFAEMFSAKRARSGAGPGVGDCTVLGRSRESRDGITFPVGRR